MREGDIVKLEIRQPDGSLKTRPLLLVKKAPKYNDWIVMAISSQTQQEVKDLDILIEENNEVFRGTGLIKKSIVRVAFINTISGKHIPGAIGRLPQEILRQAKERFAKYFLN